MFLFCGPRRVRAAHGANKFQSVFCGSVYAVKNTLRGVGVSQPHLWWGKARSAAKPAHIKRAEPF